MGQWEILSEIKNAYQGILEDNLTGIYVHGSIAFGCFNWEKSDIDFLVVVKRPPSLRQKTEMMEVLLRLDEKCPPKGMEMSVVLEKVCSPFRYPTPYELHFSNAHKERCQKDTESYCRQMNGLDKDLAAHFTVVRQVGQTLCGKPIVDVFGPVPKDDYLDSIKGDVMDALESMEKDPVYFILNLCRVLAFLREGVVLSKEQGGRWGERNLPEEYGSIAARANRAYRENHPFEGEKEQCRRFARYMLDLIELED